MVLGSELFTGTALLILSSIIILIWILIEFKRFRHKIFAIFLMVLVVFLYFGAVIVFQDKDIDFTSYSGVMDATKLYFSWLGSIFGNFKTITAGAIQLDWKDDNQTAIT